MSIQKIYYNVQLRSDTVKLLHMRYITVHEVHDGVQLC